jgi:hypothetical protein
MNLPYIRWGSSKCNWQSSDSDGRKRMVASSILVSSLVFSPPTPGQGVHLLFRLQSIERFPHL